MCRCTYLTSKYNNIRIEWVTGNAPTIFSALDLLFSDAGRWRAWPGLVSKFLKYPSSARSHCFLACSTSTCYTSTLFTLDKVTSVYGWNHLVRFPDKSMINISQIHSSWIDWNFCLHWTSRYCNLDSIGNILHPTLTSDKLFFTLMH